MLPPTSARSAHWCCPHRRDATLAAMQIVSALFVENFEMRQAPGPSTRIDLTGAMFSMAAPSEVPVTLSPHLVALIYCTATEPGNGVFEAVFRKGMSEDDEQIARNVSPFTVDPGKFTYRLVQGRIGVHGVRPDLRSLPHRQGSVAPRSVHPSAPPARGLTGIQSVSCHRH